MSQKIVKSFTINGNREMVFEIAKKYLPTFKYTIQTSQKPVLIIATRNSSVANYWILIITRVSLADVSTTLRISFSGSQNVTLIVCEYEFGIASRMILEQSDRDIIDNEMETFKNYILSEIQQSQPIQDPQPVHTQPSVNIHIGKVGDDSSIIKDSVVQHTDIGGKGNVLETKSFKICPYCGKDLNLPKTPKFCPYCGDTLS